MTREEAIKQLKINRTWAYTELREAVDMGIAALQTEPCEDKRNVLDNIRAEIIDTGAYEQETKGQTEFLRGINYCLSIIDTFNKESEYVDKVSSVRPEQKIICCKDCDEWHKGKNCDESDCYSDEGYCCVHRVITGENYYCGDAERR